MNNSLRGSTAILVVEDNIDAREIFAFALRTHGYRVFEAGNGIEALQQITTIAIDLVVTDLRMPKMDGLQLASTVKASSEFRHIPLIALTATPLANKASMLIQFAALLVKPCSIHDLVSTVDRVIGI